MKSKAAVTTVEVAPPGAPTPTDVEAKDLVQKSLEIARLEAQIRREYQAYQERPKRKFVGARAQEYRFAQYVDTWRLKIERIGNLNYPDEARQRQVHGQLVLTVALNRDGSVKRMDIIQSSGHKVLDDAAERSVQLAAPFQHLPRTGEDVDELYITRTWQYLPGDILRNR
jgi:protein TonB